MILNRGQGKNFNAGVYEWIYLYLSGGGLRSMEPRHHKIYFAVRTYSHFRDRVLYSQLNCFQKYIAI